MMNRVIVLPAEETYSIIIISNTLIVVQWNMLPLHALNIAHTCFLILPDTSAYWLVPGIVSARENVWVVTVAVTGNFCLLCPATGCSFLLHVVGSDLVVVSGGVTATDWDAVLDLVGAGVGGGAGVGAGSGVGAGAELFCPCVAVVVDVDVVVLAVVVVVVVVVDVVVVAMHATPTK